MRPLREIVDGAVGETRVGLFDGERAVALDLLRWSDDGRRARWGEVYGARVRTLDRSRGGAFLDLGLGEGAPGFLPEGRTGVTVGQGLRVRIAREAAGGKSAVVAMIGPAPPGAALGRIEGPEADLALRAAGPASAEDRALLDAAFADVIEPVAALPGGGRLVIEPTAALVAIDVDAGGREGPRERERFARDLNLVAAAEALRQLRLRNLGGIAAIDFVSMRAAEDRKAVEAAVRAAAKADPWGAQVAPMSRFGVVELSRGRLRRPHGEALLGADGRPRDETLALEAMRRIETAALSARGRVVTAHLPARALAWLEAAPISWRLALEQRIGGRWRLAALERDAVEITLT